MNKVVKWILILAVFVLIIFLWVVFAVGSMFEVGNGKFYTKDDLINNYKTNQANLYELKDFYNKLVPDDKIAEIEFENDKKISRLAITNLKTKSPDYSDQYFCEWDLDINSKKVDSVIKSLGWRHGTLTEIKSHLDKANCIGVINGEPTNIWFQRSGFGMYSYNFYSTEIPHSLESGFNDSCHYILYNRKVVLEYGGGVYGPQCFPKK